MNTLELTGTLPTDIDPSPGSGAVGLFSWVPDDEVPKAHRAIVAQHVRRLAKRHGLGELRVRFFGPPRPGPVHEIDGQLVDRGDFFWRAPDEDVIALGFAPEDQPDTIGIHHGLRGDLVEYVVAHEVHHVMRRRAGREPDEDAANQFAGAYVLARRGIRGRFASGEIEAVR